MSSISSWLNLTAQSLLATKNLCLLSTQQGFPCGSAGKESTCNAGDPGSIPGLGRSPGEGKGYTRQYSGLENSTDCLVHGVTETDRTERLSLSLFQVSKQSTLFILQLQMGRSTSNLDFKKFLPRGELKE